MLMVKKNHLFMFLLVLIPSTLDSVDGDAEGLAGVACIIGLVCYLVGLGPRYYDLHSRVCKNESTVNFPVCTKIEAVDKITTPINHYHRDKDGHYIHDPSTCPPDSLHYYPTELIDEKILSKLLNIFSLCPSDGRNISRHKFNKKTARFIPLACSSDRTSSYIAFNIGENSTDFDECMSHWPNAWALLYGLVVIISLLASVGMIYYMGCVLQSLLECIGGVCRNITKTYHNNLDRKKEHQTLLAEGNKPVFFMFRDLAGDTIKIKIKRKDISIATVNKKINDYYKINKKYLTSLDSVPCLSTMGNETITTDNELIKKTKNKSCIEFILYFTSSEHHINSLNGSDDTRRPLI